VEAARRSTVNEAIVNNESESCKSSLINNNNSTTQEVASLLLLDNFRVLQTLERSYRESSYQFIRLENAQHQITSFILSSGLHKLQNQIT